ncbi:HesA/MoeB/ThiF family protein [Candidatus Hodarchaeum mangrovi]
MDYQELSTEEKTRYSRQIVLSDIGEEGQLRIKNARVLVLGIGGLGTFSSLLLAEMGIGYLRIVDRDLVEQSNLHRTPLYTKYDLDRAKVEVAAERLLSVNPNLIIDPHACHIDEYNIDELLEGIDIVIDGLDNFETRRMVGKASRDKNIPYIFCGVSARSANMSLFNLKDSSACISCLYHGIDDNELESCDITGIHPSLLSVATGIQIHECINVIVSGTSILDGNLLIIDLRQMSFDLIPIRKNPKCLVCSDFHEEGKSIKEEGYRFVDLCGESTYMIVPKAKKTYDIAKLKKVLAQKYSVRHVGKFSLILSLSDNVQISIFKGGNVLVRNVISQDAALDIWHRVEEDIN